MTTNAQPQPPGDKLPIRLGISACLLGEAVRYDGGHKRNAFLVDTLGALVEWVPVCPEVEMGMPTPREPIRLVQIGTATRLVGIESGADHTAAMQRFARRRVAELHDRELCGYVLKKDSPSCGMERVKVYPAAGGQPAKRGRGLFAAALLQGFSWLPVEEEGRLHDPRLRENFIERVFAYHRLRQLFRARWRIGDLVAFHTAHKLQLLAHSPSDYQQLGRLVAAAKQIARGELRRQYEEQFMRALSKPATVRRHVNVLQHVLGYYKKQLDSAARGELLDVIADYRSGLVPLIVPITLLRHYARRLAVTYLLGQTYLEPHPKELLLRNHV